eukprot:m.1333488 g.1333488  ORF g.1333488 m.1333488 type:complete len:80 (-) comp24871_c0_seq4:156-395(-)
MYACEAAHVWRATHSKSNPEEPTWKLLPYDKVIIGQIEFTIADGSATGDNGGAEGSVGRLRLSTDVVGHGSSKCLYALL